VTKFEFDSLSECGLMRSDDDFSFNTEVVSCHHCALSCLAIWRTGRPMSRPWPEQLSSASREPSLTKSLRVWP